MSRSWSADFHLERFRRRMAEAERERPVLPRSTRPHLTADQLDHLASGVCDHKTDRERRLCACEEPGCHRIASAPPAEYSGPRYRLVDPGGATEGEQG